MSDVTSKFKEWIDGPYFDDETKAELKTIKDDETEVEDRFYKELDFGTGGLRAVIGAGTNRLNKYTIRRISTGYANYLNKTFGESTKERGVVIAYDNRHYSELFAKETAKTLASYNIKTYIFNGMAPTPELSFSVRELNALGGVVITASHNPPQYNGYKIYDETGCQLVPEIAEKVIQEINLINEYKTIADQKKYDKSLIVDLNEEMDYKFINAELKNMKKPDIVASMGKSLKLLYTPLHGTGKRIVFKLLKQAGFQYVYTVEEQLQPDPDFSTVSSPNPEEVAAFDMSIEVAKKKDVDMILGSDPDSDRVGIMVKDNKGEFRALTGNQIGSLLVYYLLSTEENLMKIDKPYIAKTIVTSDFGKAIAEYYGVSTIETLTGFKYIGEEVNRREDNSTFIMGYEESYGYLIGSHARDKDAVGAVLLISEMVAYYTKLGKNILDVLEELYSKFGYYDEKLISINLEAGLKGKEKVDNIMQHFRKLSKGQNSNIKSIKDYQNGIEGLPKSDVIKIIFTNNSWIAVRPSGTEPKIKFYLGTKSTTKQETENKISLLVKFIEEIVEN